MSDRRRIRIGQSWSRASRGFCLAALLSSPLLLAAGCSSATSESASTSTSTSTTVAPVGLTAKQASLLSRMLFNNRESGGAAVVGVIPYGSAATFHIKGIVDWKGHTGSFELRAVYADKRPDLAQKIFWTPTELVIPLDGLEQAMAERGRLGVHYLARPIDPTASPLDQTVRFLGALSSDRAENPLLVRQQPDAKYFGTETVAGTATEIFQFGKNARYWLAADGFVRRVEARFRSVEGPLTFEFTDRGPKDVQFPMKSEVVRAGEIPEVLALLTAQAKTGATTIPSVGG